MSRTEEIGKIYALHKASEKLHDYYGNAMLSVVQFDGRDIKNAYIDGYLKAEKDLELTLEDINIIDRLLNQCVDCSNPYQEVLKRFKERKEK